jgi:membrane protein implicated in regulation of membrane protease activity
MWGVWWVWMTGALVLAFLEVMVPGYIFLGFAIGAAVTGLLLLVAGPFVGLPGLLVIFALLSLVAWIALRQVLGVRQGQVKFWDRDINED